MKRKICRGRAFRRFWCLALLVSVFAGTVVLSAYAEAAVSSIINCKNKKFATPDEAVEYFVERISKNDFAGAMDACAIKEVKNYNFDYAIDNAGVFLPLNGMWTGKYKMYQGFNEIYMANKISQQLKGVIWSLLEPGLDSASPIRVNPQENGGDNEIKDVRQFTSSLDPSKLSTLKIEKIESDYISPTLKAKKEETDKRLAKQYNVDDVKECAVLYKWGNKYYSGGFLLVKVNNSWKIFNLAAPYFGSDASGALQETSIDNFDYKIAEMKRE